MHTNTHKHHVKRAQKGHVLEKNEHITNNNNSPRFIKPSRVLLLLLRLLLMLLSCREQQDCYGHAKSLLNFLQYGGSGGAA